MSVITVPDRAVGFGKAMLLVFGPFACGYFFSYLFRTVNAIVAPAFRLEVDLDAADLGLLSAAYFLSFAACQIPLGIVIDRYGPRRVQGTLYGVAALGAFLFSQSDGVISLTLARAMIGVGVSGGLMAALKAIVQWFPRERIAIVNGWYLTAGGLGALGATVPVEIGMSLYGWRGVFVLLAVGTLLAAIIILIVVPDKEEVVAGGTWRENIQGLIGVYRDPYFWRLTPLMFTSASGFMAIHGLWAGLWLADVRGLDQSTIANHLLLTSLGMMFGVFFSGFYAALLRKLGLTMSGICALSSCLFIAAMVVQVSLLLDVTRVIWALLGVTGTLTALVFAALSLHFPESHTGRANTAANVFVFGTSFAYQYGMGRIIQMWPQNDGGGYPSEAYVVAFAVVIATMVAAVLWYFLLGRLSPRARDSD